MKGKAVDTARVLVSLVRCDTVLLELVVVDLWDPLICVLSAVSALVATSSST
jgi:hypothetical protein